MHCDHSLEAEVSRTFAWSYWTDIRNWSDPPATFTLEGPFATGSQGITSIPGEDPRPWVIGPMEPGKSLTIEMTLDRAVFSFEWRFDEISPNRTRLTQRIAVTGENADAYREALSMFETNLPAGMRKVADAMALSSSSTSGS